MKRLKSDAGDLFHSVWLNFKDTPSNVIFNRDPTKWHLAAGSEFLSERIRDDSSPDAEQLLRDDSEDESEAEDHARDDSDDGEAPPLTADEFDRSRPDSEFLPPAEPDSDRASGKERAGSVRRDRGQAPSRAAVGPGRTSDRAGPGPGLDLDLPPVINFPLSPMMFRQVVCVRVRACVRACVCVCVCARAHAWNSRRGPLRPGIILISPSFSLALSLTHTLGISLPEKADVREFG